jgi:hypothetical protein
MGKARHTGGVVSRQFSTTSRTEGQIMPDNFPAGLFLRKTDTCLGIFKVNLSMHSLNRT